ncbi:condensin subunit ScpB [Sinobaca qinghaiensis]|uniref:Segregation and condensation protein B n=1 Tax=Sinobaca qinghaiensis TaxID=342944 RepID=A0A419V359_9BACL|nr:SMC-Scp complex subunit ScpB [Sinobaca qinghaiensis]RKD72904.1 condensin subunit ScpB [Sinobaca qinghaiensis]
MVNKEKQKAVLESLLYVSGEEGVEMEDAAGLLQISMEECSFLLEEMKQQMQKKEGGLCLKQTGTSYQMAAKDEYASYIEQYVITPDRPKLSQAALETLAIIAYNEPITKTEIDDIRSVSSGSSIQTLVAKALIAEAGRADKIGRPILYRTSKRFLEYFELTSLQELPDIQQFSEEKTDDPDQFFSRIDAWDENER